MKILLVNPPYLENVYSGFKPAVQVQLPLGLAYIAAVIEQSGKKVEVLDANAEGLNVNEAVERIINSDSDIIGFTSTTLLMPMVQEMARRVKLKTNKKIIVGGPHVTFFPKITLEECKEIDIVAQGEGEDTIRELIAKNFDDLHTIKGIAFRDSKTIVINERRTRIDSLDELPFPARHLFKLGLYKPGALWNIGFSGKQSMTTLTSRGCPSRCRYCASLHFWGPQVRFRSINSIINEIESLIEKYKIRQLAILDDTFLANKNRIEQFCDEIIRRCIKIKWWCYARLDYPYPKELFIKMRKAGCYGMNFGVESGNQKILDGVQKNIKLDMAKQIIASAKREGFLVLASFMIGLPGDTRKTVKETIDFSIHLNPHIAQFCITTPFPGTDLYNEALSKGWLKNVANWSDMGLHQRTKYRNEDLSSEEIYELYQMAHKKFYLRPEYFLLLFKHLLRNPYQFKGFLLAGIYMMTEIFQNSK